MRDRFIDAMLKCGVRPSFIPNIRASEQDAGLVYSDFDMHSVAVSRYAALPAPVQAFIRVWTAHGTLGLTPEKNFEEMFNSFIVPHELGHMVAHMARRSRSMSKWDGEYEANQFMIAFWINDPETARDFPKRIANATDYLLSLKSPVPPGDDEKAYFERNYERLGQMPDAYSWYQGKLIREAWDHRGDTNFCALVRAHPLVHKSEPGDLGEKRR